MGCVCWIAFREFGRAFGIVPVFGLFWIAGVFFLVLLSLQLEEYSATFMELGVPASRKFNSLCFSLHVVPYCIVAWFVGASLGEASRPDGQPSEGTWTPGAAPTTFEIRPVPQRGFHGPASFPSRCEVDVGDAAFREVRVQKLPISDLRSKLRFHVRHSLGVRLRKSFTLSALQNAEVQSNHRSVFRDAGDALVIDRSRLVVEG